MFRLYSHTSVPQGEYYIRAVIRDGVISITYSPCGGQSNCVQFGPSPLIDQVAKELDAFYRANKVASPGFGALVEMIDSYTCTRLGNSSQFCYDTEKRVSQTSPTVLAAQGKCSGCGVHVE